jgi:hypothetical protein
VVFPVTNFRKLAFSNNYPEIIPIVFSYLLFITGAFYDYVWRNSIVFLLNWTIMLFFEYHIVTQSLFKLDNCLKILGSSLLCIVLISISIKETVAQNNFQPMNRFDFIILVYMLAGSLVGIVRIVKRNRFEEDLIGLFVYYGLSAYALLLILATIAQALDIIENFYFTSIIIRLILLYWIFNVLWIHRLKSSLMSQYR